MTEISEMSKDIRRMAENIVSVPDKDILSLLPKIEAWVSGTSDIPFENHLPLGTPATFQVSANVS